MFKCFLDVFSRLKNIKNKKNDNHPFERFFDLLLVTRQKQKQEPRIINNFFNTKEIIKQFCIQYLNLLQSRMRYIMKGGVWKNSEDEILKAAIMKYGLNQWSRISSLLQRKSAKQCKQRWYEWLDPSIKKTEWSRAEDEKLLQLARVFPSQWRTIAPYVGRTPTQCFQRYEKLLDLAQGKTNNQSEDLKKLRPGEIDPNPETKPARLDPIDMDEDEKQMLAEVRVRLANTKGKKAKRKQRQKIIEEARRLAQLQKIRELQMAGVDNIPTAKEIKRMRQRKDIDYNKDIPFKREVPEFIGKLEESEAQQNAFFASTISLQTLQGKRRDVEQELQRKLDKKRIKKLKDRDLKSLLTQKHQAENSINPIELPEPQLTDKDIQNMRKYNITTPLNSLMPSQTPFGMTPTNKVMYSARVNLELNHREGLATPNENLENSDMIDGIEGLNRLKQMQKVQKDPNRMRSVDRLISERIKTPETHILDKDKNRIKSLFKTLKKPEQQIQFEIPEQMEQEEQEEQKDAEQIEKIEEKNRITQQNERLQRRCQALKKNLPRPELIPTNLNPQLTDGPNIMIENEMLSMLYSDALDFPTSMPTNLSDTVSPYVEPLSKEQYEKGCKKIDDYLMENQQFKCEGNKKIYEQAQNNIRFNAETKLFEKGSKEKDIFEYLSPIQIQNEYIKKVHNQEKKMKKFLGGYQKVVDKKIKQINCFEKELISLAMQKQTLEIIRENEKKIMETRLQVINKYYKMIYNAI